MHLSLNERISRQKKNEIKQLNIARIKRNIKYALFEAGVKTIFHQNKERVYQIVFYLILSKKFPYHRVNHPSIHKNLKSHYHFHRATKKHFAINNSMEAKKSLSVFFSLKAQRPTKTSVWLMANVIAIKH